MAKDEAVNEWEMTKDEVEGLEDLSVQQRALSMLTESQFLVASKVAGTEREWWTTVLKRLGLGLEEYPGFSASTITGKITRR